MAVTNAAVYQQCQIGLEVTPGTAVPANKQLLAMGLEPGVNAQSSKFRPMGRKFTTLVIPNKEMTQVGLTGQPTYTELIYPLSAFMEGTVVGSDWTFITHPGGPDDVQTFTVEYGSSVAARRFTNALVKSFGLGFSRNNGISMRGEMIGKAIEEGITLTASPTDIALVPILSRDVLVYLDDTYGAIGNTQLLNPFSANWNFNNKFDPKWVLDGTDTLGATVERVPEHTLELVHEYDAQGQALLDNYRASDTLYIRIEAIQDTYTLRLDFAGKISEPRKFSDEDGTYAMGFLLEAVEDPTWGGVAEIKIHNGITAL